MLNPSLFAADTYRDLMRIDWNKLLYRRVGLGKDNTYNTGLFGNKFNEFKKHFIAVRDSNNHWQSITNPGEQLYKLIYDYDTLSKLYKFN